MKKMNLRQCSIALPLVAVAFALLPSTPAEAGGGNDDDDGPDCTYIVNDMGDGTSGSGDLFYSDQNWGWCNNNFLSSNAKAFGMVARYWKGFGWDQACDEIHPTGRFFTAVTALHTATWGSTDPGVSGSFLEWSLEWAWKSLDTLKAGCAGRKDGLAFTNWNGHVWFYVPNYFYPTSAGATVRDTVRNVSARVGTMIHEVRHKKGMTHVPGSGGKDSKYVNEGKGGAWTYHAKWLGWYARAATAHPLGQRCQAQLEANYILKNNFNESPNLQWDFPSVPGDWGGQSVCQP